jgi:hypothetical protein
MRSRRSVRRRGGTPQFRRLSGSVSSGDLLPSPVRRGVRLSQIVFGKNPDLILRSLRSKRLEGWQQARTEQVAILRDASLRDAPQDEV